MGNIITGKLRFSFINIFTPKAGQDGGEPKYSVTLLIPKSDNVTLQALYEGIDAASQEGASSVFGGRVPPNLHIPLYDGDGLRPSGEPFGPECAGCMVITASSMQKPEVVDANLQPVLSQNDVYSGCYGRVSLAFFAYNKAGKKGIGCGLRNVQKLEDGDPLSGRTSAADDFGGGQAPVQQPYQAPYQAPVQQPYQAPVQQPYQAPVQQPYQAPVQQPYQAPYQAPVQQPYQAPAQQIDPVTGMPAAGGVIGL